MGIARRARKAVSGHSSAADDSKSLASSAGSSASLTSVGSEVEPASVATPFEEVCPDESDLPATRTEGVSVMEVSIEDKRSSKRSSKRRSSSKRKSKRASIMEEMVDTLVPPLSQENSKGKNGAIVAIYIHASVFGSILALLMGINLLGMILTPNKFPWSLYVFITWGSILGMHFGLTWSILYGTNAGTRELDLMVKQLVNNIVWVSQSFSGLFLKNFNPFPENSRLARLYDYLMLGVEPEDY